MPFPLNSCFGRRCLVAVALFVPAITASVIAAEKPEKGDRFIVAGYLPSYRMESFPIERAELVTDVILFSTEPRDDGTINDTRLTAETIRPLRKKLHERGCRVLVTIGGWGHSSAFPKVTADQTLRKRFVQNLAQFCARYELDGVDIDWEHPQTDEQHENLGLFLQELKEALQPDRRVVTIALAPWDKLTPVAIEAVDRVHLMVYDNGGRHSTPAYAEESLQKMQQLGVPAEKICLGIPFYGRPFEGKFGKASTYSEIVKRHRPAPQSDEAGGFYFNGPETVAAKVQLARERGLAGVMIWEIGQDTSDADRSLLQRIHRERAQVQDAAAQ